MKKGKVWFEDYEIEYGFCSDLYIVRDDVTYNRKHEKNVLENLTKGK